MDKLAQCATTKATARYIVLLHVSPQRTGNALDQIIGHLAAQGFVFLPLEQMLWYGVLELLTPN